MKCSDCSRDLKPIVVFDIDGTVAHYHAQLKWFCGQYFGIDNPPLREGQYWDGNGDFEDWLGIDQARYREMKLAFRQGGQKRMMPPIREGIDLYRHVMGYVDITPPGQEQLQFVREDKPEVELWFATHRPYRRLDNIDPDTRWWLDRYSLKYDRLLFSEDKYGELIQQVDQGRIIAVFEDLNSMCQRATFLGLPVRQVARDHNSHPSVSHPTRGTLEQLRYWYDDQIRNWQKQNDRSQDA